MFEIGGHMEQVFQALIDRSRVLLCLHGKHDIWCQVGGHCEPR